MGKKECPPGEPVPYTSRVGCPGPVGETPPSSPQCTRTQGGRWRDPTYIRPTQVTLRVPRLWAVLTRGPTVPPSTDSSRRRPF